MRNTFLELLRNAFSHKLSFQFRSADFLHVHMNLLAGRLLKLKLKVVYAFTASANDNSWSGCMQRNLNPVCSTLYLDFRDCGGIEFLLDIPSELDVFNQGGSISLVQVPFAFPVTYNAYSESYWMNFLAQPVAPFLTLSSRLLLRDYQQ